MPYPSKDKNARTYGKDRCNAFVMEEVVATSPSAAGYHICRIPSWRRCFFMTLQKSLE
jgi:hypothetical protein